MIFTETMNEVLGCGSSDDDDDSDEVFDDKSEEDDFSDDNSEEDDSSDDINPNPKLLTNLEPNVATYGEAELEGVVRIWQRGVHSTSTLGEWARLFRGMRKWHEQLSADRRSFVGPLIKPFRR